jgi:hypothetical protein
MREQRSGYHPRGAGGKTDRHPARRGHAFLPDRGVGIVELALDELGVAVQQLAGLGGPRAVRTALQQANLQLGLQIEHVLAQLGLRNVQGLGGCRDVAQFSYFDEITKLSNIHGLRTYQVPASKAALPPAAVVFTVSVCSAQKR